MPKTKVTPRAKHPDRTETFIDDVQTALEIFCDEISSLAVEVRTKAYKTFIKAYQVALTPVWELARFADVSLILATIHDKEMRELTVMAEKLNTPAPTTQVEKEQREVPTLDTITGLMTSQYPKQDLPSAEICTKIGNIFSHQSTANKAYSKASELLAEISTEISPEHFTLILMAATVPVIQIVVPQGMISPTVVPALPPPTAATPLGRKSIIDYTKTKVLPNPDSPALWECTRNTATRVLAAAIFSTLERKFIRPNTVKGGDSHSFQVQHIPTFKSSDRHRICLWTAPLQSQAANRQKAARRKRRVRRSHTFETTEGDIENKRHHNVQTQTHGVPNKAYSMTH